MKKLIVCSVIMMILSGTSFAQFRSNIQGPKAKNYKPWQHKKSSQVLEEVTINNVFGPKAKNKKHESKSTQKASANTVYEIQKPQVYGPKAKNS